MGITLKNNKSVTKNMTIKGDNGVGIKTITSGIPVVTEEKTTTPITVTLTDETTQDFNVEAKNGSGADKALTKPTTAPSATQIVAVDNTNTQIMLNIGDGLNIENDTLKASGGTGNKLYYKKITLNFHTEYTGLEGITQINIYFYESTDTLYDINNINTLYQKIPFAICNIQRNPTMSDGVIWILGCEPSSIVFKFKCLTTNGGIEEKDVPFEEINGTLVDMLTDYIEV